MPCRSTSKEQLFLIIFPSFSCSGWFPALFSSRWTAGHPGSVHHVPVRVNGAYFGLLLGVVEIRRGHKSWSWVWHTRGIHIQSEKEDPTSFSFTRAYNEWRSVHSHRSSLFGMNKPIKKDYLVICLCFNIKGWERKMAKKKFNPEDVIGKPYARGCFPTAVELREVRYHLLSARKKTSMDWSAWNRLCHEFLYFSWYTCIFSLHWTWSSS